MAPLSNFKMLLCTVLVIQQLLISLFCVDYYVTLTLYYLSNTLPSKGHQKAYLCGQWTLIEQQCDDCWTKGILHWNHTDERLDDGQPACLLVGYLVQSKHGAGRVLIAAGGQSHVNQQSNYNKREVQVTSLNLLLHILEQILTVMKKNYKPHNSTTCVRLHQIHMHHFQCSILKISFYPLCN